LIFSIFFIGGGDSEGGRDGEMKKERRRIRRTKRRVITWK